ncbi:hypothetical protein FISHEDRAFT_58669 [Fistulina hepatica ATCC 64428]|uniref:Uncharacterized protein n=1 Tax=Fistulina hepatica ATCC 64428 TaxID=1128425 RepID=A0A0D7AD74_9AGAR|nr:hypothetical protein FISHEDRAFT_58669 [Fistulina hepatica ATCC 64428]
MKHQLNHGNNEGNDREQLSVGIQGATIQRRSRDAARVTARGHSYPVGWSSIRHSCEKSLSKKLSNTEEFNRKLYVFGLVVTVFSRASMFEFVCSRSTVSTLAVWLIAKQALFLTHHIPNDELLFELRLDWQMRSLRGRPETWAQT